MPVPSAGPKRLARQQQLRLLRGLAQEAGWRHLALLSLLSVISSLLDIAGLGLAVTLLLGSEEAGESALPWISDLGLPASLTLLVSLILLRGLMQAQVAINRERLRSGFTDHLRRQLLHQVFSASSAQLNQLGRGDLLALLMADINRSALGLDQAVRMGQALLAIALYLASVLLVGRAAAWPLLLALLATTTAALVQRSGSWSLGRIQSRLNAALQRTVGDGLHGLKAMRAAAAESWLLERFAKETAEGRWLLKERVRRRTYYNAWRDTLVVAIAGLWMLLQEGTLQPDVLTTTLVLAYRAASSLNGVVQARRLCLGNLPGYEALCERRRQLKPDDLTNRGGTLPEATCLDVLQQRWSGFSWETQASDASNLDQLRLEQGCLLALTGPSGAGKTSCLDRVCGLLDEDQSRWRINTGARVCALAGPDGARQLHQLIAYAPQNAVLFEASLRDNLLLGSDRSTDEIETWLQRLGLGHLQQRPQGLDAPMSLAETPFSGGEVHRLGLLRAWLRDLPVEILDEPTAFLDAESAQEVRHVIRSRADERLVMVSTHDPDLLALADRVIDLHPDQPG